MKRDYQLWKNPTGKTHLSHAGLFTLCGRYVEAWWEKYPVRGGSVAADCAVCIKAVPRAQAFEALGSRGQ